MTVHRSVILAASAATLIGLVLVATAPVFSQTSLAAEASHDDGIDRQEAALARRVSLTFTDAPLREVIEKFATLTSVNIRLSKKIEDAGVQPDQRVTISGRDISADNLLSLLLRDLNLTVMWKHGALLVTTHEDAQSPENMLTRVYPVGDLIGAKGADFDPMIDLITSTVEPDTWQDLGGPGAISGFENSRSLVVVTRRDLHQKVAALLVTLRRAKGVQGIPGAEAAMSGPTSTPAKLSSSLPVHNREKAPAVRSRPASNPPAQNVHGGGGLF
ncbi:hypothetical protein [Anatilimnocola floriformis]|uniref:hypothetical protein n=1 Tax=Anatilimnocola floriformis TaxID=2948575 RepID=UPI0020C23458|nr:hypothetical protein [Anatilimnocola floriformis]